MNPGNGLRKHEVPPITAGGAVPLRAPERMPLQDSPHEPFRKPARRPLRKVETRQSRSSTKLPRIIWVICVIVPFIAINAIGARYYLAPTAVRVRDPLHPWLRPSGIIGQSAGILALVIFLFLWLYPLRKKWKALAFTGSIGKWLDVHVALALSLPFLLAIHSAWRSDGLIGLGLVAMMVVIASGIVGRYLYTRIPRAKNGVELTREDIAVQRRQMIERLAETTGLDDAAVERALDLEPDAAGHESPPKVLWHLVTNDLTRRRRTRALRQRWTTVAPGTRPLSRAALREAVSIADREISMAQQARMLDATQRVFRYWHVAHRPFAITALVAVTIHVTVVIAVGATWFR